MNEASEQGAKETGISRATIIIVASLIAIYSISQFFRNAIGVIGPDLAREFDLDARALSVLVSIFFFAFAALQIPLGMFIDRWGPKRAIIATALLCVAGTVLFSLAPDFPTLVAARLLIGAGCSSFFMGALTIYAERFPPQRFSTMVGLQLGIGTLGALAATAPLAQSTRYFGWRASFLAIAALTFILTLLVIFLVRDNEAAQAKRFERRESLAQLFKGVGEAARVKSFWPVFLMQATSYSAFAAIIGLWGGPWLSQVYGMDLATRGNVFFFIVLVQIAGIFIWGPADRWFSSYRVPGFLGGCFCCLVATIGALAPITSTWVMPYLLLYGFAFSTTPVLTAHGRALFPPQLIGRGLTLMNIGTMGGVFAQQALTGLLMESFGAKIVDGVRTYPPEAYRTVFGLIALEIVVALSLYYRANDPYPGKPEKNQ